MEEGSRQDGDGNSFGIEDVMRKNDEFRAHEREKQRGKLDDVHALSALMGPPLSGVLRQMFKDCFKDKAEEKWKRVQVGRTIFPSTPDRSHTLLPHFCGTGTIPRPTREPRRESNDPRYSLLRA